MDNDPEYVNVLNRRPTTQGPFVFMWKDIFYDVEIKIDKKATTRKTLINKVSGIAKSGEITAIMGPSGCGKTSLLNFLTDRIYFPKNSHHSGEVFINSEKIPFVQVSKLSSYVMQDDLLFDILTPKETLLFVSKLKSKKTSEEYENEVNSLLEELKLTKCKDTRIGNETTKGISGGERKRTSIGVEILSNPAILFLDEPTSGLDSQTSFIVIDFMRQLAESRNRAIVFTIHQPSSNIFHLFDRLILLNKGQCIYQGNPAGVITFFKECGLELSNKSNPADAFMHKMEEQNALIEAKEKKESQHVEETGLTGVDLAERYKEKILPSVNEEINEILAKKQSANVSEKNLKNVGFWSELWVLSHRTYLNLIRNPNTLKLKLGMTLVFSFIALSIFYNMQNDFTGIFNKVGFFFFFTINNFMSIVFNAILSFPMERGVFLREYAGRLYGVVPYYLSKNVVETPITLFVTFLFGVIVYHLAGLRADEVSHFFIFLCIYVVLAWFAQSMGLCFGAAFSNVNTALILTQFSVLPIFLFSGFLINQANMPDWIGWLRFFSPFRYTLEPAIRNEFDNNPLTAINMAEQLNLDIGLWNCVIILLLYGLGLRILGAIFLKILVRKIG